MSLRRVMQWMVRGVILAALVAFALGVWYAQSWVSPDQVRTAVIAAMQEQFPNATVSVQSARLSVFGGVTVTEMSITREGETEPFFMTPAALIAHDKESLNHGRLSIKKIELERPIFRIVCEKDGTWKLPGLDKDNKQTQTVMPTLIVRDAIVIIEDRRPNGLPELRVEKAKFQFLNDPLPVLKVQGTAQFQPLGQVVISAQYHRDSKAAAVRVELTEVNIDANFAKSLGRIKPELTDALTGVTAKASLKADVTYQPGSTKPLKSEMKMEIREGRFDDPMLPQPAEQVNASLTLTDGKLKIEKATAKVGRMTVEVNAETVPLPQLSSERFGFINAVKSEVVAAPSKEADDSVSMIESKFVHATLAFKNVPLGEELFSRLPPRATAVKKQLSPEGTVDLTYRLSRSASGWKRELELRPNKLAIVFQEFRVPVKEIEGTLRKTTASDGQSETDEVHVSLTGNVFSKRIDISGRIVGSGDDPFMELRISGDDLPIDDRIFDAFAKEKVSKQLKELHAVGRADFVATVKKDFGINRVDTSVVVNLKDGSLNFDRFAYPLDKVTGKIAIKVVGSDPERLNVAGSLKPGDPNPDRVDLIGLSGKHGGGTIWLDGSMEESTTTRDRIFALKLQGKDCVIDESFAKALHRIKLGSVYDTLQPSGTITFGANLSIITDRYSPTAAKTQPIVTDDFDPDRDLVLAVRFQGPTSKPVFFPYEFRDIRGSFRFENRRVQLMHFAARHGASQMALDLGEVRFKQDGTIWANLGQISATPLMLDDDLLKALPASLQKPIIEAKPRGAMDLQLRHFVVLMPSLKSGPPEPDALSMKVRGQSSDEVTPSYGDPIIYWDGQVKLAGASVDAGLTFGDMVGTIACRGRYDGDHLAGAIGSAWLDSAMIAGQPILKAKASFNADPQTLDASKTWQPVKLRITDVHGKYFRGEIGGEAQVIASNPPRFRLNLTAQDVQLEEFARFQQLGKDSELAGIAQAKLYLEREPDPKTGLVHLQGSGSIDVPQGRMYKLPVLLELVKLAKLHAPDQTGFEEAHAQFRIFEDRVLVDKLDLLGNAISLGGSGELDTDAKNVKLEFYTIWSQTLKRWLTTPLGDPTSALSERLFRIDATKKDGGDFVYTPRMVPIVTDPFRAVADRVKQKMGMTPDPVIRAGGFHEPKR